MSLIRRFSLRSFLWVLLFASLVQSPSFQSFAGDSTDYPMTKTKASFFGDASAGLVFEIDDFAGNTLLYRFSVKAGARIVKRAIGAENRVLYEKVLSVQEWAALSANIRNELAGAGSGESGGSLQSIELSVLPYRLTQSADGIEPDIIEVVPAFLRINANHNVTLDLRYADTSLQWDVIGRNLEGHGISVGFGVGYLQFVGSEDSEGRVWQQDGRVYGVVSGIYSFSKNLAVKGKVEIIPLVRPKHFLEFTGGIMTQSEVTLEYALSGRFVAYIKDRYDLFAVPTVKKENVPGFQGADFIESGVVFKW